MCFQQTHLAAVPKQLLLQQLKLLVSNAGLLSKVVAAEGFKKLLLHLTDGAVLDTLASTVKAAELACI